MPPNRITHVDRLGTIYAQVIVCISVVILFAALVDSNDVVLHVHVHTFSCYVSVVGFFFLMYVFISIHMNRRKESAEVSVSGMQMTLANVTHDAEGMNYFLLGGTVVFGFGALLLDAFRLSVYVQAPQAWDCVGVPYFIAACLRIFFHIAIIVFLLIHNKVVINYHLGFMRLGFMHVIAGGVATWATTVILESSHAFVNHESHKTNATYENKTHEEIKATEIKVGNCHRPKTLYDDAGDYLFCFMIEFALIAATTLYKVHCNIGSTEVHHKVEKAEEERESCMQTIGGIKGIITGVIGLIIFGGTLCAAIIFLIYEHGEHEHAYLISVLIFLVSDIILNVLAMVCTVCTIHYLSKLLFIAHGKVNFDEILLSISMFGFFFLLCFRLATEAYYASTADLRGIVSTLGLISSLLNALQSFTQVALIRDGLNRNAKDQKQQKGKHGRRWITCLILLNLAMWIVNTFELKEIYEGHIYQWTYGPLAWLVIVHVFLPLAIFFRFHSAVCLSDVWLEAYEEVEEGDEGVTENHVRVVTVN